MDFDRFTVGLLVLRDDAPLMSEAEAAGLQDAHMSHLADLHLSGHLPAAGPLFDDRYRGLLIFNADGETSRQLMEDDPAVRSGRFEFLVLPWMVPGGAVQFSTTTFPRSMAEAG
jgi:uncharacterized protein YciI